MDWQRWIRTRLGLASVEPVAVGLEHDGLTLRAAGTDLDKPWHELYTELADAREAWRKNPLARRMVGLITAYTVGQGISLHSDYEPLQQFIDDFWQHNRMGMRLDEWSDELCRSGELFPVLFFNPVSGMSTLRTVPACRIEAVDFDPEDYETELRYRESGRLGEPEKWWAGVGTFGPETRTRTERPEAGSGSTGGAGSLPPLMLHYAVNRPTGALRGESDLAPILPWLRRYSRWLEDRVRLNAGVRAFLWVVHAPARLRVQLEERYRTPPEPGSVIFADRDAEQWSAVTPNLHAGDAEKDGRAIRWMVVAGGPGTALLDMGEGEDSNLATGAAMAEQRRRFLRRRQAYLGWLLVDVVLHAWRGYRRVAGARLRLRPIGRGDLRVNLPDISPEDNAHLAGAAQALVTGLQGLAGLVGEGPAYRAMALRLYAKFLGESVDEAEFAAILAQGKPATTAAAGMPAEPHSLGRGDRPQATNGTAAQAFNTAEVFNTGEANNTGE